MIAEVPPQKILAALNYAGDVTTMYVHVHNICFSISIFIKIKVKNVFVKRITKIKNSRSFPI